MANRPDPGSTSRFSNRVENYIRYRPDYPDELLSCLSREAGLNTDWVIADIGSGTGILSKKFLNAGNPVYGVEPNDEMRTAAEQLLRGYRGFKSVKGTAEATRLPAASIDMAVAGQAFHWFDIDRARTEFLRILNPGGCVALVWNTRKTDTTPFLVEYERLLQDLSIDYRQVDHRNVTGESLARFFRGFRKRVFPNMQEFDFEGLSGRLLSSSYAPLPGHPNFAPMMRALNRIFHQHQVNGAVRFDYDTELYFGQIG